MCPDQKLVWLKNRNISAQKLKDIKKMLIHWWNETYASKTVDTPVPEKTKETRVINFFIAFLYF